MRSTLRSFWISLVASTGYPGTVVFHDLQYDDLLEDLELEPAAMVLSRVISKPNDGLVTCDAGSKSVASEAGAPVAYVVGHPQLVAQSPSEEHLPLKVTGATGPDYGEVLLLVPKHICPTVNLAEQALLVEEDGSTVVDVKARLRLVACINCRNATSLSWWSIYSGLSRARHTLALAPLRLLDRHSRVLLALGVFIGVALPGLASAQAVHHRVRHFTGRCYCSTGTRFVGQRRGLLGAFVIWQLLICPVTVVYRRLVWAVLHGVVLFLQSAYVRLAVFLLLLGIDGGLALLVSVFCVLLLPVTLTALMGIFLATALGVSLWEFFARACVMLLMPFIAALAQARLQQASGAISELNVLLLMFAIGVMDGVYVEFVDPRIRLCVCLSGWVCGRDPACRGFCCILAGWSL